MAKDSKQKSTPSTAKPKSYKLDLFKEVFPAMYRGDFDFYSRLDEDTQKGVSPLILMRWLSLAKGFEAAAPVLVNDHINQGFWRLSRHPELQWKLLCVVASNMSRTPPRHEWIKPAGKASKTPLLDGFLDQMYPLANRAEIEIVKGKITNEEEVKELAKMFGSSDDEIKKVVKEYKASYGTEA